MGVGVGLFAARAAILLIGLSGAAFGIATLREAPSNIGIVARKILNGETFSPFVLRTVIETGGSGVSGCDADRDRARLVLRAEVTDAVLLGDDLAAADDAVVALEEASLRLLRCSPREAFGWLMLYWTRTRLAGFGPGPVGDLERSYATGRNEAWIAIRRNPMAIGVLGRLPPALQDAALAEFRSLLQLQLFDGASRSIAAAPEPVRERLWAAARTLSVATRTKLALRLRQDGLPTRALDLPDDPRRPWRRD